MRETGENTEQLGLCRPRNLQAEIIQNGTDEPIYRKRVEIENRLRTQRKGRRGRSWGGGWHAHCGVTEEMRQPGSRPLQAQSAAPWWPRRWGGWRGRERLRKRHTWPYEILGWLRFIWVHITIHDTVWPNQHHVVKQSSSVKICI